MSEVTMSSGLFSSTDVAGAAEEKVHSGVGGSYGAAGWNSQGFNPQRFAQEQMRGLVRKVFFSGSERPVRQVVFSAVEPKTDVRAICRWVGEVLATETGGSVAVAGEFKAVLHHAIAVPESTERKGRLRPIATQVRGNLWFLPPAAEDRKPITVSSLHQYLSDMRREFEYSVVVGRSAAESIEAVAMAQFADGIILVLSARHTRRATARKIKESLEGSRALMMGTVLSDRAFPIPEAIYRRL